MALSLTEKQLPSNRWKFCVLERERSEFADQHTALAEFFDGFSPTFALLTCRSGVSLMHEGDPLADDLGLVLHLEGVRETETRILRHLGGTRWRCTRMLEEGGGGLVAETVRWLGVGSTDGGPVSGLRYRRYWEIDEDGALRAIAARLIEVDATAGGATGR